MSELNFNTFLVILFSIPVFATHTKLVPHTLPTGGAILAPGPHGTAALIGPIGDGAIVAAPINGHHPPHFVTHQLVPYTVAAGVPTAIPLKLLFTRFPPFIEAIVQRIQNYFSTYNVENGSYPDSPPQNDPAPTTTSTTPAPTSTTTTEAPTRATTVPPLPANEGSQTANGIYGHQNNYDNPPLQAFDRLEDSYRYDSPESRPFRYPKTGFQRFTPQDIYHPRQ
jgi:hypothetical protein